MAMIRSALDILGEKGRVVRKPGQGTFVSMPDLDGQVGASDYQRLRDLAEYGSDMLWEVDLSGAYTYCSPNVISIMGYEPEELLGKTPFDFMAPEEAKRVGEIFGGVVAAKKPFSLLSHEFCYKSGKIGVMECSGRPIFDDLGELVGYRGIDRDVTKRQRAEEAMRESEDRFRHLYEDAPFCDFSVKMDGRIQMVNRSAVELLGYPREDLIGRSVLDLYADTPAGKEKARRLDELICAGDEVRGEEMEMRRADGSSVWVSLSVQLIRDAQGYLLGTRGMVMDIMERKRVEEELRESEAHYRALVDNINDAVVINVGTKRVFVNRAFKGLHGIDAAADISDLPLEDFSVPEDREMVMARNLAFQQGERAPEVYEYRILRTDGQVRMVEASAVGITYKGESATLAVLRDVTHRKEAERERRDVEAKLLSQSRLATLGQLSTGVAHEINQPLTYMKIVNQAIMEDFELGEVDRESVMRRLEEAIRQAGRISEIVDHLRSFGRADQLELAPVNLGTILEKSLLLLSQGLHARNVELERQIEADLPNVQGNSNQLEQVFLNLFQNSLDAFPQKGKNPKITVVMKPSENEAGVELRFTDNGVGIAPEHVGRVFEPFFTTKQASEGTGLGLAVTYGIVNKHGGTIICESKLNEGTTFTITIPSKESQDDYS